MTVQPLEKAFEDYAKSIGVKSYTKLDEVILDGSSIAAVTGLQFLTKCDELRILSLNHCGIKKVDSFPEGLEIEVLELMDNQLTGETLKSLVNLKKLVHLSFIGNEINSVEELAPLKELESLVALSIGENPISKKKDYRKDVLEFLSQVQVVDGKNADGESVAESDEDEFDSEGSFDSDEESGSDEFDSEDESGSEDDSEEDVTEEHPAKKSRKDL